MLIEHTLDNVPLRRGVQQTGQGHTQVIEHSTEQLFFGSEGSKH